MVELQARSQSETGTDSQLGGTRLKARYVQPRVTNTTTPQHHHISSSIHSSIHTIHSILSSVKHPAPRVGPGHCVAASASTPLWWCRTPGITSLSVWLPREAFQVVARRQKMKDGPRVPDTCDSASLCSPPKAAPEYRAIHDPRSTIVEHQNKKQHYPIARTPAPSGIGQQTTTPNGSPACSL